MPDIGGPQISHDDIVAVLRRQQAYTDLSDEELGMFADAQLRTKGSAARVAMASYSSTNQLVLARSRVLQAKTTIPMVLTSAEKSLVRSVFPERDITFTDMERHDHGLAAAMRKIDRALVRERLPLRGSVIDVGGDYVYNLLAEDHAIHSCCPAVDAKDKFRQVERGRRLQHLVRSPTTSDKVRMRIRSFLDQPEVAANWVCNNRVEVCDRQADHLIMTHVYDMSIEQVAAALVRHGAKTVSGCMILSPDMLERDEGPLSSVNGWYKLDRNNDVMTYGTVNGSSWHYRHKWSQLRRYLHDCVVYVEQRAVAYRVMEVRGQTVYFELWPIDDREVLVDQPRRAFQVSGGPWALVKGYQFVANRGGFALVRPRPCNIRYPWDTWCRAMEYARGRIANSQFTLEDFARKMRVMAARLTVNARPVGGITPINEDQFADFLANAALAALYDVEKEKIETQTAIANIHVRRATPGPWARALRGFSALVQQPWRDGTNWVAAFGTRLKIALLDRVNVVTYELDDGSRVVEVSQFPNGTIAVGPVREPLDYDKPSPSAQVNDFVVAACMRDAELASRLHDVLRSTVEATTASGSWDTSEGFLDDLAKTLAECNSGTAATGNPKRASHGDSTESSTRVDGDTIPANTAPSSNVTMDPADMIYTMQPIAGQDQTKARQVAAALGVDDLIPSDEVGAFEIDADVANVYYKSAMVEAIRLYHAEERRANAECLRVYMKTSVGGKPDRHLLNLLQGDALKPDYYDIVDGRIATESYLGCSPVLFAHSAIYLPTVNAVHRVELDEGLPHVVGMSGYTGLGLVISDLVIFNGPEIRDAITSAIDKFDVRNFTIVIRDGVPGCGKTTQIIQNARYDDLILASGRENTTATRNRKIAVDREMSAESARNGTMFTAFQNPKRRIRTYDSYLMSRIFEKAEVVHADECFMQHSGKLMAAAVLSGARRIEFHGDTKQVPYVNRYVEEKCYRARLLFRHLHVNRYISHRCPQDAVAAIAEQYDYKIRTTSKVVRSISIATDVPLDAVSWDKSKKYITLYQDDKASAAKKCYRGGVSTVAECQGETYDHVVFVRQQARKQDLYDKWPYVLVGLSRHTKTMEFLAPSATASKFENQVNKVLDNEEFCRQFGDVTTAGVPTTLRI